MTTTYDGGGSLTSNQVVVGGAGVHGTAVWTSDSYSDQSGPSQSYYSYSLTSSSLEATLAVDSLAWLDATLTTVSLDNGTSWEDRTSSLLSDFTDRWYGSEGSVAWSDGASGTFVTHGAWFASYDTPAIESGCPGAANLWGWVQLSEVMARPDQTLVWMDDSRCGAYPGLYVDGTYRGVYQP